jgi:hypothetical protein
VGIHPRLPGLTSDREPAEALPALAVDAGDSRRAFLTKVAVGGAALTLGSQLVPATRLLPVSGAQEEEIALTADEELVEFLVSLGMAVAEVYKAAVAGTANALPEPTVELAQAFGNHHTQQASALLLGVLPEGHAVVANPSIVTEQTDLLDTASDTTGVLTALRDLEDRVAATHFAAIASLESQVDARLVATALPVVAQHAAVLSTLITDDLDVVLPETQTDEGAFVAADHPLGDPEAETEGGGAPSSESEGGGDTTTTANDGGEGAEPGEGGGTGQPGVATETPGGGGTDDGSQG